jgi:ABC-type antimicrobial peptide transport system permease subunit
MRQAMRDVDPAVPLDRVSTMEGALEGSVAPARFNTFLLTTLGAFGALLAAIGIYGVVSYFVGLRLSEIGLRLVLGATQPQVLRLLTLQGLRPIAIGVVVGLLGAALSTRLLSASLFGVSALDIPSFVVVALAILVVGLVATFIPARRALRVEPRSALGG